MLLAKTGMHRTVRQGNSTSQCFLACFSFTIRFLPVSALQYSSCLLQLCNPPPVNRRCLSGSARNGPPSALRSSIVKAGASCQIYLGGDELLEDQHLDLPPVVLALSEASGNMVIPLSHCSMGVDDAILLLCDTVTCHSEKNCLNTDGGPATDFEPPLLLFKQSVLVKHQIFMLAND